MRKTLISTALMLAAASATNVALAVPTQVTVTIENLAPAQGTNQTPHWVGFHDGTFDIYNGGEAADFLPVLNDPRRSVERLAEDGNNAPITATFNENAIGGVNGTIAGPNGPIAPGDIATATFVVDSDSGANKYFSYGSMILPSNDFWYANGNPLAHLIFDENGNFVAEDFIVTNLDVLDAGTEINDEVPANTAFFGQAAPDTGVDEDGGIRDFLADNGVVQLAFQPASEGRILADPRFAMADFSIAGYPLVKISFSAAPVAEEIVIQPTVPFQRFAATGELSGDQEVPGVITGASGASTVVVTNRRVTVVNRFRNLTDIRMAHFHLGASGSNGPVIADLIPAGTDLDNPRVQRRLTRALVSRLTADDLIGPLAGQPLNVLADAIRAGNVYVNIHTTANPSGELRGQLEAR